MPTMIALIRGINVGGNNILPMKELVRDLESIGFKSVRTYIQSGNVVFESNRKSPKTLCNQIAATIEKRHGFRPQVMVLTAKELREAIALNPFPEADAEPKTLSCFFLGSEPGEPDLDSIARDKKPSERFQLTSTVFYLYSPDGIGISKLATKAERYLGVAATARNLRTVKKLAEMVED